MDYELPYYDEYIQQSSYTLWIIIGIVTLLIAIVIVVLIVRYRKKNNTDNGTNKQQGQSCSSTTECTTGLYCFEGTCQPVKKGRGAICSTTDECAKPYECINGKCLSPSDQPDTTPTPSPTTPPVSCTPDTSCRSILCTEANQVKDQYKQRTDALLDAFLVSGNKINEQSLCDYDMVCDNGKCQFISKAGQPSRLDNQQCFFDYECKGNNCFIPVPGLAGVCTTDKLKENQACSSNVQCESGLCCQGTCKLKVSDWAKKYTGAILPDGYNAVSGIPPKDYYGQNLECIKNSGDTDKYAPYYFKQDAMKLCFPEFGVPAINDGLCDLFKNYTPEFIPGESPENKGCLITNNTPLLIEVCESLDNQSYQKNENVFCMRIEPNSQAQGPSNLLKDYNKGFYTIRTAGWNKNVTTIPTFLDPDYNKDDPVDFTKYPSNACGVLFSTMVSDGDTLTLNVNPPQTGWDSIKNKDTTQVSIFELLQQDANGNIIWNPKTGFNDYSGNLNQQPPPHCIPQLEKTLGVNPSKMKFKQINGKTGASFIPFGNTDTQKIPQSNGNYMWIGCSGNGSENTVFIVDSFDGSPIYIGSKVILRLQGFPNGLTIAPVPVNNTIDPYLNMAFYLSPLSTEFEVVNITKDSVQVKHTGRKFATDKYPAGQCNYYFMAVTDEYITKDGKNLITEPDESISDTITLSQKVE